MKTDCKDVVKGNPHSDVISTADLRVDFDPGIVDNPIVAIFQCPGSKEHETKPQHPAAGQTGKNLSLLMKMLSADVDDSITSLGGEHFFYDPNRPKTGVMVANAYRNVYLKGDRMPVAFDCEHVQFVADKIRNKKLVLCFGDFAESFYRQIRQATCPYRMRRDQQAIYCCHLGLQALNRIVKYDEDRNQIMKGCKDPTIRRVRVVAMYMKRCLDGEQLPPFKIFEEQRTNEITASIQCHS